MIHTLNFNLVARHLGCHNDGTEIQEENSDTNTSSDDGEESDKDYPRGLKRSGRLMRGSSSSLGHGVSSGNGGPQLDEDEEEEETMQSGQPTLVTRVILKKPSVPHDYIKADYMKRGKTEKAKKERGKNPMHMRRERSID